MIKTCRNGVKLLACGIIFAQANILLAEEGSPDEAAIRKSVESYVEAFNRGDAAAVASHWSDGGEWISPGGERFTGRHVIQREMEQYFEESEGTRLEVTDLVIRMLAPTVAVEEATARVLRPGELPSDTSYLAIHVKQDGRWWLDRVRETEIPTPASNYEHLKELEWLVGSWIDQDEDATIRTQCQWTKNRNFLMRTFSVQARGLGSSAGILSISKSVPGCSTRTEDTAMRPGDARATAGR